MKQDCGTTHGQYTSKSVRDYTSARARERVLTKILSNIVKQIRPDLLHA